MSGIIYKQRYANAARVPRAAIPGLNVRHLQYIATRPGAIYNEGYGFGLFGSLRANAPMADINSLTDAKKLIRAESERGRTMFRAVVSMGEPDASERGFYDRQKWETLIEANITSIAKQMHIAPQDMRWVASMHRNNGHPHTHIIFWDAGKQPRRDFISKAAFEKIAERIRAGFNREIYGAEIRQAQAEKKQGLKELRDELRAMLPEANPSGVFSVSAMQRSAGFPDLCERFQALIDHAPKTGSLKYAYLSPEYKNEIDAFVDAALRQSVFAKGFRAYLDAVRHMAELYGNSERSITENVERAVNTLKKSMANELLKAIRAELPNRRPPLSAEQRACIKAYISTGSAYLALMKALPSERIPFADIKNMPEYRALRDELKAYLDADVRWRDKVSDKELDKLLAGTVRKAQEEKGYTAEARQTGTVNTLLRLFTTLSRMTGQQQALRRQLGRSRDASLEAKKDRRAAKSLGSEENQEYE